MALIKRKRLGRDSGQALVEASLGLSLMAFTWCLIFYAAYMVNHAGKTAAAVRHAAWAKGNGVEVTEDILREGFFSSNLPLVSLETSEESTSDASGQLSGNVLVQAVLSIFPNIQKADASFGLAEDATADTWPFVIMNTRFPFMPESRLPDLVTVSTHAEWDTVSETWDSIGGMFKSIIEGLF